MNVALNVSLQPNQVIAHVPLYRNFTLDFVADLDDPLELWREVLSHGIGLPVAWLHPKGNRLWICMHFRFGLCNFTVALSRRTCIYSRAFPEGAMRRRRVRISLSPAGSFELHEDGDLSSIAVVPHSPSSEGVLIPLYTTSPFGYYPASGRLSELRLTPYVPSPPPPPPPVPATQTLLGDEWYDLLSARTATLGEVAVGTDWCLSFELWPRAAVPQRALVLAIGRGGEFFLPKVWLRPGTLAMTVCLQATGGIDPRGSWANSDVLWWHEGMCVYGSREDAAPRRVLISYAAGLLRLEEDEAVVDQRYASMNTAAFNGTHTVYTAEPWEQTYFGPPPDASVRRLTHAACAALPTPPAPPAAQIEGGAPPAAPGGEQTCAAPKPFHSVFGFFGPSAQTVAIGLGAVLALVLVALLHLPPDLWLSARVWRRCGGTRRAGRTRFVLWPRPTADSALLARDLSLKSAPADPSTHDTTSAAQQV